MSILSVHESKSNTDRVSWSLKIKAGKLPLWRHRVTQVNGRLPFFPNQRNMKPLSKLFVINGNQNAWLIREAELINLDDADVIRIIYINVSHEKILRFILKALKRRAVPSWRKFFNMEKEGGGDSVHCVYVSICVYKTTSKIGSEILQASTSSNVILG